MQPDDELYIVKMAEGEVAGTLSAGERSQLNARIAADPSFAQVYEEYYHTINSLQSAADRSKYKALLKEVHTEVTQQSSARKTGRLLRLGKREWKAAGIAASIALLSSLLTVYTVKHNEHKSDVSQNLQLVRHEMESIKRTQNRQQQQIEEIKVTTEPATPAPQSNYSGTGFAITNDGYLVTNYHVVEGAESLHVLTRNGKVYAASVVAYEPTNDIALLEIDDEDFCFSKKGDLPYSFLAGKAPLGAAVFTLGFPQDEIVYNEGYISSRNGYQGDSSQYRLEMPAGPGQSGAPIVDATGNVVGIIRSKDAQTESTTYAITSKTLLRLLHDLPKDKRPILPSGNHLAGLSRQQQIEKLQDFTCMVQVYKR